MSTRNSLVAQSAALSEPNTRLTELCLRDAASTLMTALVATSVALTVGVLSGSESTATRMRYEGKLCLALEMRSN